MANCILHLLKSKANWLKKKRAVAAVVGAPVTHLRAASVARRPLHRPGELRKIRPQSAAPGPASGSFLFTLWGGLLGGVSKAKSYFLSPFPRSSNSFWDHLRGNGFKRGCQQQGKKRSDGKSSRGSQVTPRGAPASPDPLAWDSLKDGEEQLRGGSRLPTGNQLPSISLLCRGLVWP